MIPSTKSVLLALSALAAGCSAPAPEGVRQSGTEAVARSSAADTAWTAVYVGDAHAGSVNKRSNIQAKAALALASDGTNLYLALYFCGNSSTLSADTKWLKGSVPLPASGNIADLGAVDLATPDGFSAHVSMTGPGTFTRNDGVTFDWVASYVGDGTSAGLYRYVYESGVDTEGSPLAGAIVGLIQWDGGSQGAVQFTDEHVEQVIPLLSIPFSGDGGLVPLSVPGATFPTAPAPLSISRVDPSALNAPSP
jgi:hypothetical protein